MTREEDKLNQGLKKKLIQKKLVMKISKIVVHLKREVQMMKRVKELNLGLT